jgi:hypothetical protein
MGSFEADAVAGAARAAEVAQANQNQELVNVVGSGLAAMAYALLELAEQLEGVRRSMDGLGKK